MYLIDKPLYAIELPDGSLAEDIWTKDYTTWVTFSLIHAEKELIQHGEGKIVIYSEWLEEKAAQREQMNPTSNGDDFPVTVPRTYPYRFVLVNDLIGEDVCDLNAEFIPDEIGPSDDYDLPDVWSSDEAAHEALGVLGYSVKVVKK